jgi:hypothetical protein
MNIAVQTMDAYQKNVRIADHHVTAQIVVGKSVVVGIILVNRNSPYGIKISLAALLQDVLILYALQEIVHSTLPYRSQCRL